MVFYLHHFCLQLLIFLQLFLNLWSLWMAFSSLKEGETVPDTLVLQETDTISYYLVVTVHEALEILVAENLCDNVSQDCYWLNTRKHLISIMSAYVYERKRKKMPSMKILSRKQNLYDWKLAGSCILMDTRVFIRRLWEYSRWFAVFEGEMMVIECYWNMSRN